MARNKIETARGNNTKLIENLSLSRFPVMAIYRRTVSALFHVTLPCLIVWESFVYGPKYCVFVHVFLKKS